jgi:agmatinase
MKPLPPYGDFDSTYEDSSIVILPVPYDGTSTWIKGADKGPGAMLEASANLEFYDIETDSEVWRKGIFTLPPVTENRSPEAMTDAVMKAAAEHISSGKFVVTFGGEHSVSAGAVTAHAPAYKNLSVLQLDAHSDLRPEYMGSKYNHACVMSRIKEICPAVQVGIRSMDSSEKPFIDRDRVFFAEHIHGTKSWIDRAVSLLTENVYVTIDLDVFDPAFLPATGTPEPGGMGWYDVIGLLKTVSERKNIIGFDVVELCPISGDKRSEFLAAKLIYKLLSYKFID